MSSSPLRASVASDPMTAEEDAMLASTADVWASEPSTPRQQEKKAAEPVAGLTGQFDDFDPFKPDATANQQRGGDEGRQHGAAEEGQEEEALCRPRDITPQDQKQAELPAPPTPAKKSMSTTRPSGATEASPASAIHDLGNAGAAQHSHLHPQTPSKGKATAATTSASQPMTPTSSGGLGNPLATIASAFRRRSVGASTPASRTQTPAPADRPAPQPAAPVLVLDKDETDAIDDSEKEAPQAIPSLGGGGDNGSSRDSFDGREGDSADDAVPFDFNLFLEQMRSRAAEPIGKYLRSFLKEFGKRTYGVNDQIRVINDFLDFIAVKMRENEVWKTAPEREFDNAVEAMEKLVMNRVHHQTFVPALSSSAKASTQTDDLERDHVLSQRIRLFGWVGETHLDLPQHEDSASFIDFAKQEICKVNSYKAPRDKLICILNCCKVIFGLMRHLQLDDGADTFIPFLILVVLRANPEHLISNVQYIQRFRNPERLAGENGYYLSSLTGAISFIETMDSSSLSNITQEEFESNVETAILSLPAEEADRPESLPEPLNTISASPRLPSASTPQAGHNQPVLAQPRPVAPQSPRKLTRSESVLSSLRAPLVPPPAVGDDQQRSVSPAEATRDFIMKSSDNLQKTVSKPLQALGRIFTEMGSDSELVAGLPGPQQQLHQQQHPHHRPPRSPQQAQGHSFPGAGYPFTSGNAGRPVSSRSRSSASNLASPSSPTSQARRRGYNPAYIVPDSSATHEQGPGSGPTGQLPRSASYQAGDFVNDDVSAEQVQAEADRQHRATLAASIETLASIFPGIERETLEIVLLSNGEDVERSIEGLLEMS